MQKTMEKLVTENINNKTLGHVPYIYNNLPTKQGSPQKSQCIMWLHTYREQWKTGSYTWAFLDIEAASNSTTCDITKAVHGMGLEIHSSNGLAPSWVTEKSQPHLQEKHWKGLWPSTVHRGTFYYPKAVNPSCCQTHRGPWEWLSSSAENNQIVSHSLYRRLRVRNNSDVEKLNYQSIHRRFSTWSIK